MMNTQLAALQTILAYHQRTKHRFEGATGIVLPALGGSRIETAIPFDMSPTL